jgi:hypothetical protein
MKRILLVTTALVAACAPKYQRTSFPTNLPDPVVSISVDADVAGATVVLQYGSGKRHTFVTTTMFRQNKNTFLARFDGQNGVTAAALILFTTNELHQQGILVHPNFPAHPIIGRRGEKETGGFAIYWSEQRPSLHVDLYCRGNGCVGQVVIGLSARAEPATQPE